MMKPLNRSYATRLYAVAALVKQQLSEMRLDPGLTTLREKPWRTDTLGWTCAIARLSKTGQADFELWYDLFPNVGRPVLSLSFWAQDPKRVEAVAQAHAGNGRYRGAYDNAKLSPTRQHMATPLPSRLFNQPILELYDEPFVSVYLSESSASVKVLAAAVLAKLPAMIAAAAGALRPKDRFEDFPSITERRLVRRHATWERSRALAEKAKARDGFICTVCGFNFGAVYGAIGRGFAEAHHVRPLSALKTKTIQSSADDLKTVCANCHRMLHKMSGHRNDIVVLKKRVGAYQKAQP